MPDLKIFICEDSEGIRDSLKKLLAPVKSIQIIGVADRVESAANFLSKNKPDISIVDLNLPDGSGYDILDLIKNSPDPHTVIILTNHSADFYRKKAIEKGADYFFDKSTEFEKIIDVIDLLGISTN